MSFLFMGQIWSISVDFTGSCIFIFHRSWHLVTNHCSIYCRVHLELNLVAVDCAVQFVQIQSCIMDPRSSPSLTLVETWVSSLFGNCEVLVCYICEWSVGQSEVEKTSRYAFGAGLELPANFISFRVKSPRII